MKLKQCPKCHKKVAVPESRQIFMLGGWRMRWWVKCKDCAYEIGPYMQPEDAVRYWNRPVKKKKV